MAIYKNSPPIVTNGLVLHLDAANPKSYISGSTTWKDISGTGKSGSLYKNNGATPSLPFLDISTQSMVFTASCTTINSLDGLSTGSSFVITAYDAINISGSQPYTVSSLFKFTTWPVPISRSAGYDVDDGTALVVRNSYNPSYGMNISYRTPTAVSGAFTSAKIYYGIRQGGSPLTASQWTSNTSFQINTWYYVAHTQYWDGTKHNLSLYINGILDSYNTSTQFVEYWTNANTLGIANTQLIGSNGIFSNLNVANTCVYNRALSQQEIVQNYNAIKSRYNLT